MATKTAFLGIFRAILAEKWPYRPCSARYGHFGGRLAGRGEDSGCAAGSDCKRSIVRRRERRLPESYSAPLQSEPALRLLQRTDKQEEQAQENQDEVDDLALEVFLVEE